MASKIVEDLKAVAYDLEAQGFPVSAGTCIRAALRMERMEELIVSMASEVEAIDSSEQT